LLPGYYRRLTLVLIIPLIIIGIWFAGFIYRDEHRGYLSCEPDSSCIAESDGSIIEHRYTDVDDNSFTGLDLYFEDEDRAESKYNQNFNYNVVTSKRNLNFISANSETLKFFPDTKPFTAENYANYEVNLMLGRVGSPDIHHIGNRGIIEIRCSNLIIPTDLNKEFTARSCIFPIELSKHSGTLSFLATPEFIDWAHKIKTNYDEKIREVKNIQKIGAFFGFFTPFIMYTFISGIILLLVKSIRYVRGA
jgi:hypothetical protein